MIQSKLLTSLKDWKCGGQLRYCMGVDVGGSGLRVRLSNLANPGEFIDHPHVKVNTAPSFYKCFEELNDHVQSAVPGAECAGSSFAIAGLRKGDSVTIMNWPAPTESRTVKMSCLPKSVAPRNRVVLMNDLEGCAYGVFSSGESGGLKTYFEQICGPANADVVSNGHTAVLAMGSGLGAAVIARDIVTKVPIVVATEMGWSLATGVGKRHEQYKEDRGLLETMSRKAWKGQWAPIYENMASGTGLVNDYDFIRGKSGSSTKALDIVKRAKKGDANAIRAMEMHYLYFTKCAKNLAMSMNCESIVMALSNQVENAWLVRQMKDKIGAELRDLPRTDRMRNVSIFGQVRECNFNIVGTSYMARRVAGKP